MTELEKVQRDIDGLNESIRLSMHALADPALPAEAKAGERASITANQGYLAELLARRDELRGQAAD